MIYTIEQYLDHVQIMNTIDVLTIFLTLINTILLSFAIITTHNDKPKDNDKTKDDDGVI